MSINAETAFRVLPSVLLATTAWALAWLATGSIDAADWLPYAALAALLVLVVVFSGGARRPGRAELGALAALVALAGWEAISISWSAVPSLARDEALLTLFYAAVFLLPLLTLTGPSDRLLASAAVALSSGALALGAAFVLRFGSDQADHFYWGRRLSFPISYPNAVAAVFLIGFWPAVVLSADRRRNVLVRSCSLAGATAVAAASLTAQSKGSIAAMTVSCALLFALSPLRLRLLVPTVAALGLTAIAYRPLTEPFRTGSVDDIRHAGTTVVVLTAIGAVAGVVYAVADRRLGLGQRALGLVRVAVGALAVVAAVACIAVFFTQVYHSGWFGDQWRSFKNERPVGEASSHLLQLGSYRYDFWRVALDEFKEHPLAGVGSRGFGPAYLQLRHGPETPARAHSVELDALSELGIVGLLLLVCALALPLIRIVMRMRARDPAATAAFAAAAYWLAHASVDWIWTVPACGVGFFLLLGIGASGEEPRLGRRAQLGLATAALVAVLLFVPPWLSARFADHGDFSAAKALDPLSVDPYRLEASEAATPRAAVEQLEAAVRKEPRVADVRYELGLAYARAREVRRARAALLEALRLAPGDPQIAEALMRLPKRPIRSS